MIERIAQLLTELTGHPVSNGAVTGALVVLGFSVLLILFGRAWHNGGQIDWDAVEAERKRLEEEE